MVAVSTDDPSMKEFINPVSLPGMMSYTTAVNCLKEESASAPLTREGLERAMQALQEGRLPYEAYQQRQWGLYQTRQEEPRSFLSPEVHQRIDDLCRQDPLFTAAWREFTGRVRSGLNDHIVRGFIDVVRMLSREMVKERDRLNDRNLDNIRGLGGAAVQVIKAYEAALARGDVEYMTEAIEELDAAVYDINQKGVLDA